MSRKQTIAYPIRDSLYLNITDRCTLRCRFCPKNNDSWDVKGHDLELERRPTAAEVIEAIEEAGGADAFEEIVFCGFGEPTLRLEVLLAVAHWLKGAGGGPHVRVRVNTDGLGDRVHGDSILPLLAPCVDALSVSMNAQDEATYDRHCDPRLDGSYESMLGFLAQAPTYIPDVTATAIDGLPGVDIEACRRLAQDRGVGFRARALDVVG